MNDDEPLTPTGRGGSVPVPDPTALTTNAVEASERRTDEKLDQLRQLLEMRISGVNKDAESAKQTADVANVEMQKQLDRRMADLYASLEDERRCERDITTARIDALDKFLAGELRGLHRETKDLSDSVLQRFGALEKRTAEQKEDNTKAIDKAEGATQKAIEKAEQNTSERVSSIDSKIEALSSALDRQIRDLKEQVDRGDRGGLGVGQDFARARAERAIDEQAARTEANRALFFRAATIVGSAIAVAIAVVGAVRLG